MAKRQFINPFRPGSGHKPPYLAGRKEETSEFRKLLQQDVILDNLILTGLRGVGKTVLLDQWKPLAQSAGWMWVGTDLSESSSLSEKRIADRLLADLAVVTSSFEIRKQEVRELGFHGASRTLSVTLGHEVLQRLFDSTPGLTEDKLKKVLETVWSVVRSRDELRGIVFAYDEAQNLADHADRDEYPASLLLDVFQSIQKKDIPFMLALTGLPTLFPKLVEARTFAERMFRVVSLDRLNDEDSREAIEKPISNAKLPIEPDDAAVQTIVDLSGGYPYFLQFICREVYETFAFHFFLKLEMVFGPDDIPEAEITRKLDTDFFAGRWARATDRQRELLTVIASLENCDDEFSIDDIGTMSCEMLEKPFGRSQINQMLRALAEHGLVFKNRHGRYSFAVPLLGGFIRRQTSGG